jgi:hypothetical protein
MNSTHTTHLRASAFFRIAGPDSLVLAINRYITVAFPAPVVSLSLYRDADLDGYHGDIGQLEFAVADETTGEILSSHFLENDATLTVGTNCFCSECETDNVPLAMISRRDRKIQITQTREMLRQLGLE